MMDTAIHLGLMVADRFSLKMRIARVHDWLMKKRSPPVE